MSTDKAGRGQPREDDAEVSAVYREMAAGSTPEHLDTLVLGRAAMAARPRLGRMRRWTRPLAWAATIALSVAIVLEVARSPGPDGVPISPPLEMNRVDRPDAAKAEAAGATMPAAVADEAGVSPAPAASPDALPSRQRVSESLEAPSAAGADAGPARPEAGPLMEQEMDLSEPAATLPGDARKLALPAAVEVRDDAAESAACDSEARSTAESWLDCIEQLEQSGHTAEAERERELLLDTFGDFLPH